MQKLKVKKVFKLDARMVAEEATFETFKFLKK